VTEEELDLPALPALSEPSEEAPEEAPAEQ
jgi:hypothetical protein